jgi:hypothetical protein
MENNSNNKKIFIIIIFLVILALIGAGLFLYFNNKTINPVPVVNNNFPQGRPGNGFYSTSTNQDRPSTTTTIDNQYTPSSKILSLRKISQDPIAGAAAFSLNGQSYARFTDKATGHTYETDLGQISLARLTNTTIPKIYEAVWSQKGNGVSLRYLNNTETIQTYWAKMGQNSSSTNDLAGTFLPSNVKQFAVNPAGDKLFYLLDNANGSSGFIADINLVKRSQIFNSTASEWLVSWPKDDNIIFTTKPSYQALGYAYSLNAKTETFTKLFGSIYGLTTLYNGDANNVLYSESIDQSIKLHAFDSKNKIVTDFSLKTLPEKCVWSQKSKNIVNCAVPQNLPQADYPDAWYQGAVSFQDQIWRLDAATGDVKLMSTLFEANDFIDATNPILDPTETYLLFTNKNDFQLWGLTLI